LPNIHDAILRRDLTSYLNVQSRAPPKKAACLAICKQGEERKTEGRFSANKHAKEMPFSPLLKEAVRR